MLLQQPHRGIFCVEHLVLSLFSKAILFFLGEKKRPATLSIILSTDYSPLPSSSSLHKRQSSIQVKQQQQQQQRSFQHWIKKMNFTLQSKKRFLLSITSVLLFLFLIWALVPTETYSSLPSYYSNNNNNNDIGKTALALV